MDHGHVKDYEIYFSGDGKTWGQPAAKGAFRKGAFTQTVRLPRIVTARYLKFVALSEQSGQAFATAAEISVIEARR